MYLYFAAKVRKSIHIIAYQCIKKQKEGRRSLIYTKKEVDSHLPLFGNLTNFLFSNRKILHFKLYVLIIHSQPIADQTYELSFYFLTYSLKPLTLPGAPCSARGKYSKAEIVTSLPISTIPRCGKLAPFSVCQ